MRTATAQIDCKSMMDEFQALENLTDRLAACINDMKSRTDHLVHPILVNEKAQTQVYFVLKNNSLLYSDLLYSVYIVPRINVLFS